jgi:hypothetical protein
MYTYIYTYQVGGGADVVAADALRRRPLPAHPHGRQRRHRGPGRGVAPEAVEPGHGGGELGCHVWRLCRRRRSVPLYRPQLARSGVVLVVVAVELKCVWLKAWTRGGVGWEPPGQLVACSGHSWIGSGSSLLTWRRLVRAGKLPRRSDRIRCDTGLLSTHVACSMYGAESLRLRATARSLS